MVLRKAFEVKLLREPLLHFFLIGAAIYGAYAFYGAPDQVAMDDDRRIVVDEEKVEGFIASWQARMYRPPTQEELNGLIERYIRESIYYQEAVAMGLDQGDPITRRRMAQKLEFLTKDVAALNQPADGELERFFEQNADRYKSPDLITFTHIFLDPDKRGDATLDDANKLLADLQASGAPGKATADKGDLSMLPNDFFRQPELQVSKSFGSGFAASVMTLESGRWHGPVLSGYGTHLVYVFELEEAPAPAFEQVKDMVLQDWQDRQQEIVDEEFYKALKRKYEIVVEGVPSLSGSLGAPDRDVSGNSNPGTGNS
jgi:hypothetical protein